MNSLQHFAQASNRYLPDPIHLLFIAEAPPALRVHRFFYFTGLTNGDTLFLELMKVLYPAEVGFAGESFQLGFSIQQMRHNKANLLCRFQADGYFLIDACEQPMPHRATTSTKMQRMKSALPALLQTLERLLPQSRDPHHPDWRSHLCSLCRAASTQWLEDPEPVDDQSPCARQSASLPRKTRRDAATWKVNHGGEASSGTHPAKPPSSADRATPLNRSPPLPRPAHPPPRNTSPLPASRRGRRIHTPPSPPAFHRSRFPPRSHPRPAPAAASQSRHDRPAPPSAAALHHRHATSYPRARRAAAETPPALSAQTHKPSQIHPQAASLSPQPAGGHPLQRKPAPHPLHPLRRALQIQPSAPCGQKLRCRPASVAQARVDRALPPINRAPRSSSNSIKGICTPTRSGCPLVAVSISVVDPPPYASDSAFTVRARIQQHPRDRDNVLGRPLPKVLHSIRRAVVQQRRTMLAQASAPSPAQDPCRAVPASARSSPATIASTAASKVVTGDCAFSSARTCSANFGQLRNPCSRARKNCASASNGGAPPFFFRSSCQRLSIHSARCSNRLGSP